MPQMDKFAYASQMIWLILTILSIYMLVSGYILPRIKLNLIAREEKIKGLLKESSKNDAWCYSLGEKYLWKQKEEFLRLKAILNIKQ